MKTVEITGTTYKSSGKWIEIKYRNNEEATPYFMNNGICHILDNYVRTNCAWCDMPDYHKAGLHAYNSTDPYYPDFIRINSTGDAVMIWRQAL